MRGLRRLVVAGACLAALVTPATLGASAPASSNLACARQLVATWSLRQLAQRTVVLPVAASDVASALPAARAGYGGLILFGATAPASFVASLARVRAAAWGGYSMMVMTDEEGGGVQRLTNLFAPLPWAKTMGRTMSAAQIQSRARSVGRSLAAAGVNVDLAPVLDVDARADYPGATNPDGLRSFSGSAAVVSSDGVAFMNGLGQAGVTAVVKHFPGLGGANQNTDYGPAHTRPWTVLERAGLRPFVAAISAGAPAVMLANASVPGLTSLPASISPEVVTELRTNLGFAGLIMTDSLSAGAFSALGMSVPTAAVAALRAGADQVLFGFPSAPVTPSSMANLIVRAMLAGVANGTLARATLEDAAAHVLATGTSLSCPAPPATTSTL
jgi:beta-N-acetylhexosaminidase